VADPPVLTIYYSTKQIDWIIFQSCLSF
jgi:hypothetical protein